MESAKFSFTDEEFITILNMLFKLDAPPGEEFIPLTSMDEKITVDRLDSLSSVVFFIWISELFGISEDKVNDFMKAGNYSGRALKDFVMAEATQAYSYKQALEYSQRCF
jgi:hypothetical protein